MYAANASRYDADAPIHETDALRRQPPSNSMKSGQILRKRVKVQGFIIFDDFGHLYSEFAKEMSAWIAAGKIKYREEIIDGLESAPKAFIGLLRGENFGKRVIRVGHK